MESNSLHPYETSVEDNQNYWFLTKDGIIYNATFSDSSGYFCRHPQFDNHIVTFAFIRYLGLHGAYKPGQCIKEAVPDYQIRIRDTIISLLLEFFQTYPHKSVVIVCESDDKLEACRQRLFDRWFYKASQLIPHSISKYNSDFGGEGFGSIFIHNDNPDHELVRDAFLGIGIFGSGK